MLSHSIGTKPSLRDDSYAFKSTEIQFDCDCWYADSGASEHISDNGALFKSFQLIRPGERFIKRVGKNNEAFHATGTESISIRSKVEGE
jgi:hypothetical protein